WVSWCIQKASSYFLEHDLSVVSAEAGQFGDLPGVVKSESAFAGYGVDAQQPASRNNLRLRYRGIDLGLHQDRNNGAAPRQQTPDAPATGDIKRCICS